MSEALTHYFGLTTPFTLDELKAAYRRLAQRLHPDRGGSTAAFQTLQHNYRAAQPLCRRPETRYTRARPQSGDTSTRAKYRHSTPRNARPENSLIDEILAEWAFENQVCELLYRQLAEQWGIDNSLILLEYLRELLKARQNKHCPSHAWQVMVDKYGTDLTRVLLPWNVAQELQGRVFHS